MTDLQRFVAVARQAAKLGKLYELRMQLLQAAIEARR